MLQAEVFCVHDTDCTLWGIHTLWCSYCPIQWISTKPNADVRTLFSSVSTAVERSFSLYCQCRSKQTAALLRDCRSLSFPSSGHMTLNKRVELVPTHNNVIRHSKTQIKVECVHHPAAFVLQTSMIPHCEERPAGTLLRDHRFHWMIKWEKKIPQTTLKEEAEPYLETRRSQRMDYPVILDNHQATP